jgi:hypothetical protein
MLYLEYNNLDNLGITCSECGWIGLGEELKIEEFDENNFIIDFCCPKCFEHIGFTQPPLREEK